MKNVAIIIIIILKAFVFWLYSLIRMKLHKTKSNNYVILLLLLCYNNNNNNNKNKQKLIFKDKKAAIHLN
jgi:predicted permease